MEIPKIKGKPAKAHSSHPSHVNVKSNIWLSVALGFWAAVISSLIWYALVVISGWQIGIIAIFVGYIVGYAVMYGSGNAGSRTLQIIGVSLTLFGMILSEYLISRHYISKYLVGEGYESLPLLLSPDKIFMIVKDAVVSDPLTLLFWAIALWGAFSVAKPAVHTA